MSQSTITARPADLLVRLPWPRLLALSAFSFALTLTAASMESAVFSHKVLRLAPDSPNTLLGFSTFIATGLAIILGPLIGTLSDRTRSSLGRRKPFLIIGVSVMILAFLVIAASPGIALFVLGVLLYRLGDSLIYTPWQALYPDHVPMNQRGHGAGFKGVMDVLGLIIGRFSAGELLARFPEMGETALFAAIAVPALGLLVALVVTLRALRSFPASQPATDQPKLWDSLKTSFSFRLRDHPAFVAWFVNRLLFWTAFVMVTQFLLLFVIDVLDMAEADAQRYLSRLFVVIGAMMLLIAIPSGKLADRLGRKPLIILGCALAASGVSLILLSRDITALTIAGGLFSLGAGIFVSSSFAMVTDIVPAQEAGRFLGLANIAGGVGAALARLLGGALIDPINKLSGSSTAGYLTLYSLAALLFITSLWAAFKLPGWKEEKEVFKTSAVR